MQIVMCLLLLWQLINYFITYNIYFAFNNVTYYLLSLCIFCEVFSTAAHWIYNIFWNKVWHFVWVVHSTKLAPYNKAIFKLFIFVLLSIGQIIGSRIGLNTFSFWLYQYLTLLSNSIIVILSPYPISDVDRLSCVSGQEIFLRAPDNKNDWVWNENRCKSAEEAKSEHLMLLFQVIKRL